MAEAADRQGPQSPAAPLGALTLIGAGELLPAMSRAHREALQRVPGQVRAVFLDTPAGFETNVDAITAKAVEYYRHRLQTELHVASYRHATRATPAETARAVAEIRAANFIFAGPGSSTYALDQWRGSAVLEAVEERFRQGAHVLLASAAALTAGRFALPVYEIYKAGRDPYWVEGLNLLGAFGLDIAVVAHFNDNSGGDVYDSRFCYMGAARFDALQALLPPEVAILGIDEYTTVAFLPAAPGALVGGQGTATVIANGERSVWPAGATIPFEQLRSSRRGVVPTVPRAAETLGYAYGEPTAGDDALAALADYTAELSELSAAQRVELLARVEAALRAAGPPAASHEPRLMDLLIELRSALRTAKRYDLADRSRAVLEELGYQIADTPDGSTWTRQ